jgi:hypothetical protein
MSPVGFDPTISASERPKTYALDRAATGAGLPIAPPAENFDSVFVIPASYLGGRVSIIDPDSR